MINYVMLLLFIFLFQPGRTDLNESCNNFGLADTALFVVERGRHCCDGRARRAHASSRGAAGSRALALPAVSQPSPPESVRAEPRPPRS